MTFKSKIASSFGLFVLLVVSLGTGLMVNSYREEKVFHAGRNSLRVQYMAQDVDYFLNRTFRALQGYVLLGDDAERGQLREAQDILREKFDLWAQWVRAREARPQELDALKAVHKDISARSDRILRLMDEGQRIVAMGLVETEFLPALKKSRGSLRAVKEKTVQDTKETEKAMLRVVRESHIASLAGIGMALILGVVLSATLYRSIMLPMKVIAMWSEQITHGHLHVSLDLPVNSEMAGLAKSFNGMVRALSQRGEEQPQKKNPVKEERIPDLEEAIRGFRTVMGLEEKNDG